MMQFTQDNSDDDFVTQFRRTVTMSLPAYISHPIANVYNVAKPYSCIPVFAIKIVILLGSEHLTMSHGAIGVDDQITGNHGKASAHLWAKARCEAFVGQGERRLVILVRRGIGSKLHPNTGNHTE